MLTSVAVNLPQCCQCKRACGPDPIDACELHGEDEGDGKTTSCSTAAAATDNSAGALRGGS
eukprot:5821495-Prorocentrum_lima.AAC.1